MKTVLRWVAVLPAAIGCYFLASAGVGLFNFVMGLIYDSAWSHGMLGFVQMIASGVAYIWFGSMVAPTHRFITGIVLATIYTMICLFLIGYFFAVTPANRIETWANLWILISFLASIAACYLTMPAVKDREDQAELNKNH